MFTRNVFFFMRAGGEDGKVSCVTDGSYVPVSRAYGNNHLGSYFVRRIKLDLRYVAECSYHRGVAGAGCMMKCSRAGAIGRITVQRFHGLRKVFDDANVVASGGAH